MASPKSKKPTLQERRAVAPPSGVSKSPPDDIHPDSILNHAAPTMDEIEHLPQGKLSLFLESANIPHIEKRITLLARLIIENALWHREGLTVKERADLALNAIRTLEGSKSKLWIEDPNEATIPKSSEAMAKEKTRIEERMLELLKEKIAAEEQKAEDNEKSPEEAALKLIGVEKNANVD